MTPARALDRFLGELARRGYSARTRDDYFRKLCLLCDGLDDEASIADVTPGTIMGAISGMRGSTAAKSCCACSAETPGLRRATAL